MKSASCPNQFLNPSNALCKLPHSVQWSRWLLWQHVVAADTQARRTWGGNGFPPNSILHCVPKDNSALSHGYNKHTIHLCRLIIIVHCPDRVSRSRLSKCHEVLWYLFYAKGLITVTARAKIHSNTAPLFPMATGKTCSIWYFVFVG